MRRLFVVISAPSGAGKSTLCERLLADDRKFVFSVSCTTRPPRGHERDGVEYHFLSPQAFERHAADGLFLEHATVHGHRYGTLRSEVRDAIDAGRDVLLDIDVQGARQVRATVHAAPPDDPLRRGHVDIFIAPPSLAALRERLEKRGEDTPEAIRGRLRNAESEMAAASEYRHRVVNDVLDEAYARLRNVIEEERRADG